MKPLLIAIDLMLDRWEIPKSTPADDCGQNVHWAIATHYLLKHNVEEALHWARRHTTDKPDYTHGHNFFPLTLLRAELAAGHADAAMQLLQARWDAGHRHYLDDFFLARIASLRNEDDAAAQHYDTVLHAVERYKAEGRLDFELRLACELSPGALARMARRSASAKSSARLNVPHNTAGEPRGINRLVGRSPALAGIRDLIVQVAGSDVPVLITGETGTGKEMVARALHESGPRASLPFIAINCGAVAETLLESELFGHAAGAFTGASHAHKGIFESAGKGTVFLDEIGEISPHFQTVLLRILDSGEFVPVGSARAKTYACRVIAATNAPLEQMIAQKRFRPDLLYRLRRLEVSIPPLRERPDDILPLAALFLDRGRQDGARSTIQPDLKDALRNHPWPGNVRELRNAIERMRLLNSDKLDYCSADLALQAQGNVTAGIALPPRSAASSALHAAVPSSPHSIPEHGPLGLRRVAQIRALFRQNPNLHAEEVSRMLKISRHTASRYLHILVGEGYLEKVQPTASPRTHYFAVRQAETQTTKS